MAHHASTPASVLNAPMRRRTVLSRQDDLNRAERRRAFRTLDEKGKPVVAFRRKGTISRDQQLPTKNRPYRKGDPTSTRRTAVARAASAVGRVRSIAARGGNR